MDLKHLMIAAIVANAAKSGWPADSRLLAGPDRRKISRTRGRPTGLLPVYRIAWNRHQRRAEKTDKKRQERCFALPRCFFSKPLCQCRQFHAVMVKASEIPALDIKGAGSRIGAGDKCNPLRIQRAAAPELSGIRVGWRCTTVGPCSTASSPQAFWPGDRTRS